VRLTVAVETPARAATSWMVTGLRGLRRRFPFFAFTLITKITGVAGASAQKGLTPLILIIHSM
jgi:hypothetical protein